MVEKYNPQHQGRLSEVRDAEVGLHRAYKSRANLIQSIMQQFCEALPENRLLHGNDDLEKVLEKEAGKRTFTIQASGAKLTYHSAIAILARYASSLVNAIHVIE